MHAWTLVLYWGFSCEKCNVESVLMSDVIIKAEISIMGILMDAALVIPLQESNERVFSINSFVNQDPDSIYTNIGNPIVEIR